MNIYYVYAYLRKSTLTPYYIGKGSGKRYKSKDHKVKVPTDSWRIVFLETNLTNVGACALERRYIKWYGRKDLGTGILRNITNGGEGAPGRVPWNKGKKGMQVAWNKNISGAESHCYGIKRPYKSEELKSEKNPMYIKSSREKMSKFKTEWWIKAKAAKAAFVDTKLD